MTQEANRSIFAARREKVRVAMRRAGLDAMLVCDPSNRFYLSGFELRNGQCNESSGCLLLTSDGCDRLCTDGRFREAARALWNENDILIYSGNMAAEINKLIRRVSGGLVGIEAASVNMCFFRAVSAGLPVLPVENMVENIRMIKEPAEIAAMEKSCALNHKLMESVPSMLVEGMSEKDLSWEIEKFFRENGASELAFSTIAAFGRGGALPHYEPGDMRLAPEMPVLIDAGGRLGEYCSDQTRTFWFGKKPDPQFSTALDQVREAQKAAIAAIKPGVKASEVYKAGYDSLERAGVAEALTHGLGHGVGLDTHEAPSLSPRCSVTLEPGMVLAVEPGLYYPEWGGVRWEYMVLVEADGPRIL